MIELCHISTTFNSQAGSARRTKSILNESVNQGYNSSLLIGRDNDLINNQLPGVEIQIVPQLVKYISAYEDIRSLLKIIKILKKTKPHIVHTHLAKAGFSGRLAAKIAGVPIIIHTVHGPTFPEGIHWTKRVLYRMLEKISALCTDRFVFVGEELRDSYIKAGICTLEQSHVIYTGRPDKQINRVSLSQDQIENLKFELCGKHRPEYLILCVGRIVPSKQFDHAIIALSQLQQKGLNARLVIVGKALLSEEKYHEDELKDVAHKYGVYSRVHFTGYRSDILDVMESSDVVLLTSKYEGLPNVAVEAALAGTPMVAYDVSGIREVVEKYNTGYVVSKNNINELTETLEDVYNKRYQFRQDILKSKEYINGIFNEKHMVQQKMELYDSLLKRLK
jgi:glycosyltransferase involved in cell wall biosynthesis